MLPALLALTIANPALGASMPGRGMATTDRALAPVQQAQDVDEQRHQKDLRADREEGKRLAAEVAKEYIIVNDPEQQARVDRIGHELAAIANANRVTALWGDKRLNPFDYDFHIVVDKDPKRAEDVNAFSIPGGHIYVLKALLKFCQSDDELAGVLGHEIAHAAFRHLPILERDERKLSQAQIPIMLAGLLLGGVGGAVGAAGVTGLAGQSTASGWSVQAEEAADYGGFQYLLKSHYDPTGMLTFMERLALMERNDPLPFALGIYRDHPPTPQREASLVHYMTLASVPIRRSRVAASFRTDAIAGSDGTVMLNFGGRPLVALAGSDAQSRAETAARRLNDFFDAVPEAYEVQAGDSGTIVTGRNPLVALTAADAAVAKIPLEGLQKKTLEHIRSALFSIGYRVWDTH